MRNCNDATVAAETLGKVLGGGSSINVMAWAVAIPVTYLEFRSTKRR